MRAVTIDSDLATLFTFTPRKPPITPIQGVGGHQILAAFSHHTARQGRGLARTGTHTGSPYPDRHRAGYSG